MGLFREARIVRSSPTEAVVSVDGAFEGPGLDLSHWPGNRTPVELRRDLSTGIALEFVRLSKSKQLQLSAGAQLVVNNHYDTDGCCAAFVLLHPEAALGMSQRLLTIAACGDLYQVPDEDAFCADAVITNMADPGRSTLGYRLDGLLDLDRWSLAQAEVFRILPDLCARRMEPTRTLWEPELKRLRGDLSVLERCERQQFPALDLSLWRTRGNDEPSPGRHALFATCASDRVLYLSSTDGTTVRAKPQGGTLARLILSTSSWFDLLSTRRQPRPDLGALVSKLNECEGSHPGDRHAWRAQGQSNASPELWFGSAELGLFAEHNTALGPSQLEQEQILEIILAGLAVTHKAEKPA